MEQFEENRLTGRDEGSSLSQPLSNANETVGMCVVYTSIEGRCRVQVSWKVNRTSFGLYNSIKIIVNKLMHCNDQAITIVQTKF